MHINVLLFGIFFFIFWVSELMQLNHILEVVKITSTLHYKKVKNCLTKATFAN